MERSENWRHWPIWMKQWQGPLQTFDTMVLMMFHLAVVLEGVASQGPMINRVFREEAKDPTQACIMNLNPGKLVPDRMMNQAPSWGIQ
jgi:hypothetical protein